MFPEKLVGRYTFRKTVAPAPEWRDFRIKIR